MRLENLFKKDVTRNINGVIKVGQQDEESVHQELSEYIITKELDRYFNQFYDVYAASLVTPTDKIGVWISGFFGSGKSSLSPYRIGVAPDSACQLSKTRFHLWVSRPPGTSPNLQIFVPHPPYNRIYFPPTPQA